MPEEYRIVNPTDVRWEDISNKGVIHSHGKWKRIVWQGVKPPNEHDLVEVANSTRTSLMAQGGRSGWMETRPSDTLLVQKNREVKLGRISLPLGWKTQYEMAVSAIKGYYRAA